MAELTIIMPAYNIATHINEAVESILVQSYSDFELWIIDDGSTDTTLDKASGFTDSRIKIFKNYTNTGRDRTANEFVKKIQSPFFTITDADDVSHPARLQRQMDVLRKDDQLYLCGTSYAAIDANGFMIRKMILPTEYNTIRQGLEYRIPFHGPTTIMRREVLTSLSGFYREDLFDCYADTDLACRIAERFKSTNVPDILYYYRILPSSMSQNGVTPYRLKVYSLICSLHQQRNESGIDANELEKKDFDKIKRELLKDFDEASFYRQLAFTSLYWGLIEKSVNAGWKAFKSAPWHMKNIFSLTVVIIKSGLFYLYRSLNKVHYSKFE